MSFFGKTRQLSGTPPELQPLRGDIGTALRGGVQGADVAGGIDFAFGRTPDYASNADSDFFLKHLLEPYSRMFASSRASALDQAKESAGNLTGSGYNNLFGSALEQSLSTEQFGLAQVLNALRGQEIQRGLTMRGQDLSRQGQLLQFLLGFATGGVGSPQTVYQPGFIDYFAPIIASAAGAAAGRST